MDSEIKKLINQFKKEGFTKSNKILDKNECAKLYKKVKKNRNWDKNLFMLEKNFLKNPQLTKTNPGKGIQNLSEEFDLDFLEKNKKINNFLNLVLGDNWEIMLSKFVVAVPQQWMPDYVKKIHTKSLISNFNPYIKKKFRDVTYFHGIDYHMDSRDNKGGTNKFITMYIYLNDTNINMSPLNVIKKSHLNGHTTFPHWIKDEKNKDYLFYKENKNKFYKKFFKETLIGRTGSVYFWTSNTLHGTMPSHTTHNKFRISLRYLIKSNDKNKMIIDNIIKGNKIKKVNETRKKSKRTLI